MEDHATRRVLPPHPACTPPLWVGLVNSPSSPLMSLRVRCGTYSGMEGGSLPRGCSRRSAARTRFHKPRRFQIWRARPFQNAVLAFAPRALFLN
eukprot:5912941-Pyramimonas_sp.AAC.1